MLDSQTIKKSQGQIFAQMKNSKKSFLTENLFQDLIEGKNEWVNIQLIIREAFKQVKEAIENQYFYFDKIEQKIEDKIDCKEAIQELDKKATVEEVGNLLKDLNFQVQEKISLRNLIEKLSDYTLKNEFQKQILQIYDKFQEQDQKFAQNSQQKKLENKLEKLNEKIQLLEQQQQQYLLIDQYKKQNDTIEQDLTKKEQQIQELQNQYTLLQIDMQNKKDKKEIQQEMVQLCNDQIIIQKQVNAKIKKNQIQIDSLQNQIDLKADNDEIENIVEKNDLKFQEYESYKIKENLEMQHKSLKILEDQFEQQKLINQQNLQKKANHIVQQLETFQCQFQKKLKEIDIKENYEDFKTQMAVKISELKNTCKNLQNKTKEIAEQQIVCIETDIKTQEDQLKRNAEQIVSVSNQQISLKDQLAEMLANLKTEAQAQQDIQKNDYNNKFKKFNKTLSQITKNLEGINETKVNLTKFSLLEKKMKQQLDQKCSIEQLRKAMQELSLNQTKYQNLFRESQENLLKVQEKDFKSQLRKKTSNEELNTILKNFTHRQDLEQSQNLLCSAIRNTEEKYDSIDKKMNQILRLEFDLREFKEMQKEIPKIHDNLLKKLERDDVQYLLNQKANTQQINAILEQLQSKINRKVSKKDIDKLMEEQNHFNKFFCTELILARYKWKTGLFLDNNIIPFDTEVVNTLKENFIWQKNSGILHVVNGGLYEVKYGFFGQKKPVIQILVNQNVVFKSNGVKQKNQKNTQNWMFSNNGVTGVTFFLVADNSQIQIQCIGELVVEGFLNIKRF